jgi:hypothetical protein
MSSYLILRHYIGNVWRFIKTPWQQRIISISEATSIFACSFDRTGWNHIVQTLEAYDVCPDIPLHETQLYNFLMKFCPRNIIDLSGGNRKHSNIPLFTYPWGTMFLSEGSIEKDAWRSRFCGPSTDEFIEEEYKRIIALYEHMKKTGYQPWAMNNGFIGGTFLINRHGQRRFVVLQGNHRMAIMAHLGVKRIAVRSITGYLQRVEEEDISNWALVKKGMFSEDEALMIFRIFFKENGFHIKAWLDEESGKKLKAI